jgi:dipeptidyl-peptidase-4
MKFRKPPLRYSLSIFILSFIAVIISCGEDTCLTLTVPETTDYEQTSLHAEVMSFLDTLKEHSSLIHIEQIATSAQGNDIPLVVLADPPITTPEEAIASGKPVIYIQGNIHGGEVDGKEALLEIMREIVLCNNKSLISDQILLLCPIYNTDGNDAFSEKNRPNDNGPIEAGERPNGEGYDLNRDGIKAEAIETKGLLKNVIVKWDPILLVDLHTTNGTWHGYSLTYAPPYNPSGHQGPRDYLMDTMLPAIGESLDEHHDMQTNLYGVFSGYPPTSWTNYSHKPRFLVNYAGLRNRMAILCESFAHDPFEERILTSKLFTLSIIEYTNMHGRDMQEIIKQADEETVNNVSRNAGNFEKGVRFEVTPQDELIDLLVYEMVPVVDPETGEETLEPTENIISTPGVQIFNNYEATELSTFPRGYIFPGELTMVAEKLKEHGIAVLFLDEHVEAKGEEFIITSFNKSTDEYENHFEVTLEGFFQTTIKEFPAGIYLVDLAQPLANLAFYMLEPESDDGLVRWNYFDDYLLEKGVESKEIPFPVFKYQIVSHEGCS